MKKLIFAMTMAVTGAVCASVAYQGQLRGATGEKVSVRTPTITFGLYSEPTAADSLLWNGEKLVTLDEEGLFNVELTGRSKSEVEFNGAKKQQPDIDEVISWAGRNGRALYIGLTVSGSSGEIRPRQKLLDVPFADFAKDVANASGDFKVAGKTTVTNLYVEGAAEFAQDVEFAKGVTLSAGLKLSGGAVSGFNASDYQDFKVAGKEVLPQGMIIMWYGTVDKIPRGWALCDGKEHSYTSGGKTVKATTPNLLNRFVVGAGSTYKMGDTGGADSVKLNIDQMPSHNHGYSFKGADLKASWDDDNYFYDASGHYSGNNNTKYTEYTGGGKAHENRPPYYALYYIMKL